MVLDTAEPFLRTQLHHQLNGIRHQSEAECQAVPLEKKTIPTEQE